MFLAVAWIIIGYVLFQFPQPGIADQGDFDRVMNMSGLTVPTEDMNDPTFVRFLSFTVTDYQINSINTSELWDRLKSTSIAYLITIISLICKALGQDTFKTGYLAVTYAIMYTTAIYLMVKYLLPGKTVKQIALMVVAALVLLDGNYLIWFNSLYGEPMMITTLLLYAAAWAYYIYQRYKVHATQNIFPCMLFISLTALLFLGSKLQVISSLPIIFLMLVGLTWENKHTLKAYQTIIMCLFICVMIIYPLGINRVYRDISKDTQYNSVFFGVIRDSDDPVLDLTSMGLSPDLAIDAGKHAFLDKHEYQKYVPHTTITTTEFYNRISNGKLIYFYLTHPGRLYAGMQYTASQAFYTSTTLGKYTRQYSEIPIGTFSRFTWWSSWRENYLPKNLFFLIIAFGAVAAVSTIDYLKNRNNPFVRAQIRLLWAVLGIGLIQFPMPYVGNGHADTAKQLFLFNFTFDLLLVTSVYWCFSKLFEAVHLSNHSNPLPIGYLQKFTSSSGH